MSSIVSQAYEQTFGIQSPLKKIVTESGIVMTASKNMLNINSQIARKRMFDMYMTSSNVFPSNITDINETVRLGIKELISPFFKFSVESSIDGVDSIRREYYENGELRCAANLSKITGVKNISIFIMNNKKETNTCKKGISIYIDRDIKSVQNYPSLDIKWTNGFFQFKDPSSLNIVILIPKEYIKHIMLNVQASISKNLYAGVANHIIFKDACFEVIMQDLLKAFFVAAYTDDYRIKILSDIMTLFTICQSEGFYIATDPKIISDLNNNSEYIQNLKEKYKQILLNHFKENKQFSVLKQINDFCENMWFNGTTINPFDFYDLFISIPYEESIAIMKKIPSFSRLDTGRSIYSIFNFNNDLQSLDIFLDDDSRYIIPFTLKLIRILPFIYYNAYVVGASGEHGRIMQFTNTINSIIFTLNNFKNTNRMYINICNFIIDNLNYMINILYKEMSSPQIISSSMRRVLYILLSSEMIYN